LKVKQLDQIMANHGTSSFLPLNLELWISQVGETVEFFFKASLGRNGKIVLSLVASPSGLGSHLLELIESQSYSQSSRPSTDILFSSDSLDMFAPSLWIWIHDLLKRGKVESNKQINI
jgi:hypothetical protein